MFSCGFPKSNRFQQKLLQLTPKQYDNFDMNIRAAFLQPERFMSAIIPGIYEKNGITHLMFIADIEGATISVIFLKTGFAGLFDFCLDETDVKEQISEEQRQ